MSAPLEPGRDATKAFASGFAGCLGVGLAILVVLVVLIIIGVMASHGNGGG